MSKTIKIIAIVAILNSVVFGGCFYLFVNIKKIDKIVSERLAQIESEAKKDELFRSIKNLMNDTEKEREQIVELFVPPNGTVDFIETVESLSKIADIKLEIESVGVGALKSKTGSSTESFRLSFRTEGTWNGTMHLLSLLENMPYKISFENVRLGKVSGGSSSGDGKKPAMSYWKGNFSFNVLKMKNPPEKTTKIN